MSLQFIMGNSGSGKSYCLYDTVVREAIENPDKNYLVIVPEQFTMQTQKDLCLAHPKGGIMNIDVLSFGRLAYRVFEEVGQDARVVLDDEGKNLVLRKIAGECEKDLKVFKGNLKKQGYISEVKSVLSEFAQYGVDFERLDDFMKEVPPESYLHYKLDDIRTIYEKFEEYLSEKYITKEEMLGYLGRVELAYDENTFSFEISTINYDSPGNALYSWKLEGFYEKWTQPGANNLIRFTNLPPGRYILHVRAISREEHDIVFQERAMKIIITQPFWSSWWAILCYILLVIGGFYFVLRVINLRKQKNISDEKTQFFINTAHDIRTPLTLIKAPLEELLEEETLTDNGITRTNIALRNVEVLLRLVSNLINFERTDVYSSKMSVSEYELNTYMNEIYNSFSSYAAIRRIEYTYESTFSYMNVSFDKEKMDSILKNIISNSLKYTPENGKVSISVSDTNDSWKVIIKDTGIGIPASEQSKLFKLHFRASNAINSKVTGSGIGLMLVGKLVSLHGGKISVDSVEHQGTTNKIVFPKNGKLFLH